MCSCQNGFFGDPFLFCYETPEIIKPKDPCNPTPCGPNARCSVSDSDIAVCSCESGYFGNPYETCRPECIMNSECPFNKACLRNKCDDPCPGVCGTTAICNVINHLPICTCASGYTGNPYSYCHIVLEKFGMFTFFFIVVLEYFTIILVLFNLNFKIIAENISRDPCIPNPCGSNSVCKNNRGVVSCSCVSDYIGTPPNCRPECTVNSECEVSKSCINHKCADPCLGVCGQNSICKVINHAPICSCGQGYTGDPFTKCIEIQSRYK